MKKRKQAARSRPANRSALVADLNRAVRDTSGVGVLFSQAVGERLGINSTDLECIDLIARGDRVTAGALAAATGLTSGAVTGVIDRLERAGFARRKRDPDDRRVVLIRLVPEAGARAEALYRSLGNAADKLAGRYSEAELALLIDYLDRSREIAVREIARLKRKP